jgi:hypothetical protein
VDCPVRAEAARALAKVDEADLRDAASEIWENPVLQTMAPELAAARWLRPLTTGVDRP